MQTLEELLKRALAQGYDYDDFVVKQLCRQIAAEKQVNHFVSCI